MVRAYLAVLMITGLLQIPAASQQVAPPANSATQTQDSAAGTQQTTGEIATIIQSRSTNTPGFRLMIHDDGSATEESTNFGPNHPSKTLAQVHRYSPGTIDVQTLRHLLTRIGDVSRIPTGFCPKSVSFGTRTQISYQGKLSGDLQCIRGGQGVDQSLLQPSLELSKFVQNVVKQVKVPVGRPITVFNNPARDSATR
jgi:hypothetical protein